MAGVDVFEVFTTAELDQLEEGPTLALAQILYEADTDEWFEVAPGGNIQIAYYRDSAPVIGDVQVETRFVGDRLFVREVRVEPAVSESFGYV